MKKLIDDEKLPESPESLTDAPEALDDDPLDIPRKYVGDVDLPESEEPLLKESRRRFVLFPIQYHEVMFFLYLAFTMWLTFWTLDLANVQESRGFILDCRGDGPF